MPRVLLYSPDKDKLANYEGTGWQIGDGVVLTAGHVVYQFNEEDNISQRAVVTLPSTQVLWDPRGYYNAYVSAANALPDPLPAPSPGFNVSNQYIEPDLKSKDMVAISEGGNVGKNDAGLAVYLDPAMILTDELGLGIFPGSTLSRDGRNSGLDEGQGMSLSSGGYIFSEASIPGDSGGAHLITSHGKQYVIGNTVTSATFATLFTYQEFFNLNTYLQQFQSGDVTNTEPTNMVIGSGSADVIVGTYRSDILVGGNGNDTIKDGDDVGDNVWADDTLIGGDGDDIFFAGGGSDSISGGLEGVDAGTIDGYDTVDYSLLQKGIGISFIGVTENVNKITVGDGTGDVDKLYSIEKIIGTDFRDYFAYAGIVSDNTNLTIDARSGQTGNDIINLDGAAAAMELNIGSNGNGTLTSTGSTGQITLLNFHTEIIGSDYADQISDASSGDKRISGGAGDDIISAAGSSGNATLYGGAGEDTLIGGDGNDVLMDEESYHRESPNLLVSDGNAFFGGGGSDYITSISSKDTIDGGAGNDYIRIAYDSGYFGSGDWDVQGGTGDDYIETVYRNSLNYKFSKGDGHDTIFRHQWGPDHWGSISSDINVDLTDIEISDLKLIWDTPNYNNNYYHGFADLVILVKSTGDSIYIPNIYGQVTTGTQSSHNHQLFLSFNYEVPYYLDDLEVVFGDTSSYATDLTSFRSATAPSSTDTTGSSGDDNLRGGLGDDTLSGGDGDDHFTSSGGGDVINGGNGTDTVEFFGARSNFVVTGAGGGGSGGSVVLTDQTGHEGVVTMAGIESVYFVTDNQSYTMEDLLGYYGTNSNDVISATIVDNQIYGLEGNDTLSGLNGDDIINGGEGDDYIDGGVGSDTAAFAGSLSNYQIMRLSNGTVLVNDLVGDDGNDILIGIETLDFDQGGSTISVSSLPMYGTSGDDSITGEDANDVIYGLGGNDQIQGGMGFDTIYGGDGDDLLNGGELTDTISGGTGTDTVELSGLPSDYRIYWSTASEVTVEDLRGIDGQDTLTDVEIIKFAGDDSTLLISSLPPYGTSGDDVLTGTDRADHLIGLDGNDLLTGGLGDDVLDGGTSADTMSGGEGDDYYIVDDAGDIIIESAEEGYDWVDVYTSYYTLSDNVEDAYVWQAVATTIVGNGIGNYLGGDEANDTLSGLAGNDWLDGYGGNDRLTGGAGDDLIDGGSGTNDIAVFAGLQASYTIATNGGVVTITDNQPSTDGNDGVDTVSGIEKVEFKGGVQVGISSPIVLDLNGDGVNLVARSQSNTRFDWEGDGTANRTGWVGKDDGFLVYDRNHDGKVSNGQELSFIDDKPGAKSDLDGLSAFDSNADGLFSADDAAFADFRVWKDANGNGRSDQGEMLTLADAGIASITLAGTAVNKNWGWEDNLTINTGAFTWADGREGQFSDVALNYESNALHGQRGSSLRNVLGTLRDRQAQAGEISRSAGQLAEAIAAFGDGRGGDIVQLRNMQESHEPVIAASGFAGQGFSRSSYL